MNSWRNKRILVTGSSGFVGTNLKPHLASLGGQLYTPDRKECNLLDQERVNRLFQDYRPHLVIHLAGLIGGILANLDRPADFCRQNALMGTLVLHAAWESGAEKFVTLMGGCSYPGSAPSPIKESALWMGYPSPESAPYSLAKALLYEMACAYRKQYGFNAITLVPGNLYGPHDNFDLANSHVIPGLIRKFIEAEERGEEQVTAWGTGRPIRDFVYVTDVCQATIKAINEYDCPELINISSGEPVTIRELVTLVADVTGYQGDLVWDTSKPDGQMEKGFDVTRMREVLGFHCATPLRTGLERTVQWYRNNRSSETAARA